MDKHSNRELSQCYTTLHRQQLGNEKFCFRYISTNRKLYRRKYKMLDLLKEFNADSNKVVSFVHNNGSNIDLATRLLENELGWFSMECAGHTLQLCVNTKVILHPLQVATTCFEC